MRPSIEQISHEHEYDFTFRLKRMRCESCLFEWHYHQEYEIMLMRHCEGQIFVGKYNGSAGHNTLAMCGPRLPHTFMDQRRFETPVDSLVLWFSQTWINQLLTALPELMPISKLLGKANHGLLFSTDLAEEVFKQLEHFDDLSLMQQSHRFIEVLIMLAEANSVVELNTSAHNSLDDNLRKKDKVTKIMNFIELYYHQPLSIEQLAEYLHLSKSSIQRIFSRHFTETFSEHLKQFRIGKSCQQLVNSEDPIAVIAENVGFGNLSNFNRQFKHCKNITPRQFRASYRKSNSSDSSGS